ncbi:hypothetical protein SAMN04487833_1742 [Sarcina sp. DSM 11001]|uniref:hypothetical protein n=1 Tax=Sarcina sp. DSM 11001 TaxID=1798184 RepID=UPI00088616FC|nr:hypothetical protein [Sarcina sp. DSM 11001]SDM09673.1 hypothetical protein SAMN04487833_1742 [Sarcina sp. DSM 11001]
MYNRDIQFCQPACPCNKVCEHGAATVYGTPWDGKHHLGHNIAAPVRAICILEKSKEDRIRAITKTEALPMMIRQTYCPADPKALAKTLSLLVPIGVRAGPAW